MAALSVVICIQNCLLLEVASFLSFTSVGKNLRLMKSGLTKSRLRAVMTNIRGSEAVSDSQMCINTIFLRYTLLCTTSTTTVVYVSNLLILGIYK